jgi:hypothetical protein
MIYKNTHSLKDFISCSITCQFGDHTKDIIPAIKYGKGELHYYAKVIGDKREEYLLVHTGKKQFQFFEGYKIIANNTRIAITEHLKGLGYKEVPPC